MSTVLAWMAARGTGISRSRIVLLGSITAAGVATAIALGAGSATYVDPTGDNPGGAAADVTTIRVSNADDGTIEVRIETPNRPSQMPDDALGVYLDADANPSTGQNGMDYRVGAFSGPIELNRWTGSVWDAAAVPSFTASWSNGLTFSFKRADLGVDRSFRFWIYAVFKGANPDYAPDGASGSPYVYTLDAAPLVQDRDRDGVPDSRDKCPTVKAGKFDPNKNGCAGPYPVIEPRIVAVASASAGTTTFKSVRFASLPPGTLVKLRGRAAVERLVANRSGVASSKALLNKAFPVGTTLAVEMMRKNTIGYSSKLVVQDKAPPLKVALRRCLPVSSVTPKACSTVDRGK